MSVTNSSRPPPDTHNVTTHPGQHCDELGRHFYTYHGKGVTAALRASGERSALGLGQALKQLATDPRGSREEFGSHFQQQREERSGQHTRDVVAMGG